MDSRVWLGRRDKMLLCHSMHETRLHHLHLPSQHSLPSLHPQFSYSHTDLSTSSLRAASFATSLWLQILASAIAEMDTMEKLETTVQRGDGKKATQEG